MYKGRSNDLIQKMQSGRKCIVGMIHCLPLPGTLYYGGDMELIFQRAIADAMSLMSAGVDAIMVENTNDKPSSAKLEPEQIAVLAAVTRMVVEKSTVPVGVGASFNDGIAGMSIACAANADFIRSPGFVDSRQVTGLGTLSPCAKEIVRLRRLLGAEHIGIWADVQVKHSHPLYTPVPLTESALEARDCGADALIVTGVSTGMETPLGAVQTVKNVTTLPVVVGSGFNINNAKEQLQIADGAIVGSGMKQNADVLKPIDSTLSQALMDRVRCVEKELLS